MFKKFFEKAYIDRIYRPETRDLDNGLRCDKNERVELWDNEFFDSLPVNQFIAVNGEWHDHLIFYKNHKFYFDIGKKTKLRFDFVRIFLL